MRVWIDVTNSPHVAFFRPLVALLRERGDEVTITAREFAQTLELLDDAGLEHTVVGPPHGGASRLAKVRAMSGRLTALRGFARGRGFDLALVARLPRAATRRAVARIPSAYAFDYEFALAQHRLGSVAATRVVVPEAIPQERLDAPRRAGAEGRPLPGAEGGVLPARLPPGSVRARRARARSLARPRRRPDAAGGVALPRRRHDALRGRARRGSPATDVSRPSSCRARPAQREALRAVASPSLVVPDRAVDALSLVALADLVVSAGGTMNREAVALGTPVYTTFAGRLGAVDEQLVRDGRLRRLTGAGALALERRGDGDRPRTRPPETLLDLLLGAA